MIKIFIVSVIVMLYEYGLKKFVSTGVSRRPMKYLKHVLKLHEQYLPKYSYTRYIHPLLARMRSPKYNKAQSKRKANAREANTSKHRRHLSLL